MLALVIISSLLLVYFVLTVATIVAWEILPTSLTPDWLDTAYEFFTFQW